MLKIREAIGVLLFMSAGIVRLVNLSFALLPR